MVSKWRLLPRLMRWPYVVEDIQQVVLVRSHVQFRHDPRIRDVVGVYVLQKEQ
jgi:hypothetical protein